MAGSLRFLHDEKQLGVDTYLYSKPRFYMEVNLACTLCSNLSISSLESATLLRVKCSDKMGHQTNKWTVKGISNEFILTWLVYKLL